MKHIHTESELRHHGVEATSNHLESPDCLDQIMNRLRTVELSPLQGSKPELLFIKLLLAHSPSLEKFTIQSDGTLDANKRFNIAKDVTRFPRASSKAELICLYPKSCKNVLVHLCLYFVCIRSLCKRCPDLCCKLTKSTILRFDLDNI
ncbi:putative FBD domain-containing protein [Helianthus anomalus]